MSSQELNGLDRVENALVSFDNDLLYSPIISDRADFRFQSYAFQVRSFLGTYDDAEALISEIDWETSEPLLEQTDVTNVLKRLRQYKLPREYRYLRDDLVRSSKLLAICERQQPSLLEDDFLLLKVIEAIHKRAEVTRDLEDRDLEKERWISRRTSEVLKIENLLKENHPFSSMRIELPESFLRKMAFLAQYKKFSFKAIENDPVILGTLVDYSDRFYSELKKINISDSLILRGAYRLSSSDLQFLIEESYASFGNIGIVATVIRRICKFNFGLKKDAVLQAQNEYVKILEELIGDSEDSLAINKDLISQANHIFSAPARAVEDARAFLKNKKANRHLNKRKKAMRVTKHAWLKGQKIPSLISLDGEELKNQIAKVARIIAIKASTRMGIKPSSPDVDDVYQAAQLAAYSNLQASPKTSYEVVGNMALNALTEARKLSPDSSLFLIKAISRRD